MLFALSVVIEVAFVHIISNYSSRALISHAVAVVAVAVVDS